MRVSTRLRDEDAFLWRETKEVFLDGLTNIIGRAFVSLLFIAPDCLAAWFRCVRSRTPVASGSPTGFPARADWRWRTDKCLRNIRVFFPGRSPRDRATAAPASSPSRSTVPSAPCCACSPAPPGFASSDRSLSPIAPRLKIIRLYNRTNLVNWARNIS